MDFQLPQFSLVLPEITLLVLASVILLVDVFIAERFRILTYALTQITLIMAFVVTLPFVREYETALVTFSGHYTVDKLATLTKLFIYLFTFFAFLYSRDYFAARKSMRSEYYLLGLLSVLGMSIMASAASLLTAYLGIELLSLCLYAMIALHKESAQAKEAAMKYFVLGSLASAILLYGISILYGVTGTLSLTSIAQALEYRHDIAPLVALIFVLAGLIFKFGAVPFHMWVPDVYQGAATPTTLYMASAPKVAAFVILMRILVEAMPSLSAHWQQMLIVVSILSMFLGNLLAIAQHNLKRMLAYSSIAHVGYTLLGVIAGPDTNMGYSSAMFYIFTYVLVAAGGFAVITLMSRNGVDFDRVEDYRGLNARNPWLAFMMLLLLFSMAGVPPTVGFFAKLGLIEALVAANYVWLAVLALLFALIGAYYYLRVVMLMYFEEPDVEMSAPVTLSPNAWLAISVNGSLALVLGLLPSYFIELCRISLG